MTARWIATTLLLFSCTSTPAAQQIQDGAAPEAIRTARAVRIPNGRIVLDGRLDEPEWSLTQPASDFVQQAPAEGAPATEPTEAWIVYDDDTLYIGATLHDRTPERLVTDELTYDFSPRDGDMFGVIFDTFHDRLNGYGFFTNPAGAKRDSQVADDGRANNQDWNAVWDIMTSVGPDGWVVEFAIPFKTLRFPEGDVQVWGMNLVRVIRHKNELAIWSLVPRPFGLSKVSYAGVLEGIRGVQPGQNIRVKPFATSELHQRRGVDQTDIDGGVDVKVGLGTGLILDVTYRPDFAQVEVDAQQINLTRFSLFFPEKREFFLENRNAFQIGSPRTGNDFVPFFSRRIGLSPAGEPVPLVGGLRLSGKVGRNTLGLLNIQSDTLERTGQSALPSSNASVLRYAREFLNNSLAGVFYLGNERTGGSNRLVGSDVQLHLWRALNIDTLWMRSDTTGVGVGTTWRVGVNYDSNVTTYQTSYTAIGNTFRNELGFVRRPGTDVLAATLARRFRPQATYRIIREYRPRVSYERFTKNGLGVETETISPSFSVDFADASVATFSYVFNEEALTSPFPIHPDFAIPVGRYRFENGVASFTTSRARRLSGNGGYRFGEFWNGHRRGVTAGARLRVNAKLATGLTYGRDVIDLPGFSFTTNLLSLRVDGSFSTRMFLNAFIQYNSVSREVISNIRFNFIHHPLSDLYIVFNETRPTTGSRFRARALILKFTQLLNF